MKVFTGSEEVIAAEGSDLGVSEYVTVTQKDVDTFADVTGDISGFMWTSSACRGARSAQPLP
jgi:acyl dehydratase